LPSATGGEKIVILNKTRRSSERYRIVEEPMGCSGLPDNHPNHKYSVLYGNDRKGTGYPAYMSVSYFLEEEPASEEAKENCRKFLRERGYTL
jgi:hypothetical protein